MGYLKKIRDRREYERNRPVRAKREITIKYDPVILERNRIAIEEEMGRPMYFRDYLLNR